MENLTSAAKTTIIVVFAIYTLFQFFYSFLSRQAMKKGAGSGDFMSKFYTGGRSGGVLVTAMMVSPAWPARACSWACPATPTPSAPSGWCAASSPCAPTSWCWA